MSARQLPPLNAVGPVQPDHSAGLRSALRRALEPHPDVRDELDGVADHVRTEANRAARLLEEGLGTATTEDWVRFLRPLSVLANAPKGADEIRFSVAVFAFTFPDMPTCCLTPAAQREALRRLTFWPKPSDLSPILDPEARRLRAEVHALRRIASAPPEPEPTRPSPEQQAQMAAKARAVSAELLAKAAERETRRSGGDRPRYLSRAQLAELCEEAVRRGSPRAESLRFRAGVLREQLADGLD